MQSHLQLRRTIERTGKDIRAGWQEEAFPVSLHEMWAHFCLIITERNSDLKRRAKGIFKTKHEYTSENKIKEKIKL